MPSVFEFELVVPQSAIDALGHANNAVYLQWMEAAATAHSAAQGWTTDAYLSKGIAWVARSHFIEYRRPANEGDRIIVKTWVKSLQRVSSTRAYRIEKQPKEEDEPGTLLAWAETCWVMIDIHSGRPRRIPPAVATCFAIVDALDARKPNIG